MQTTTNYGLRKPDGTDPVKRSDFNTNFDLIDSAMKETDNKVATVSGQTLPYAVAAGTANTYTVTISPTPTAYTDGMGICVKINVASTGASTLNVNGLGAKAIKDSLGNAITAGGLKANTPYTVRYESTSGSFILQGKGGGGTADASKILSGYTATTDSGQVTGTIASKAAATITPGTANQTIAAGQYLSGVQTIAGDADLISANIKSGANIFGVAGSSTVVDTANAVLDPAYLVTGYSGYDDGVLKSGTMPIRGNEEYSGWRRAELGTVGAASGRAHFAIPNGAYFGTANSGMQGIFVDDANFIAANIVSGRNIFGLTGTSKAMPTVDNKYTKYPTWLYQCQSNFPVNSLEPQPKGVANNKMYMAVPIDGTLYIYDFNTDTWTTGANMPSTNISSTSCGTIVGDKFYVTGRGLIYIYTISTNTWSIGAVPPYSLFGSGCTAYNNKLYVVHGRLTSNLAYSNVMMIYDIPTNTWTYVTGGANVAHSGVSVANGIIYIIGGANGGPTVYSYSYNIATNTWTQLADILGPGIYECTVDYYGGMLYVCGGTGLSSALYVNEVYIYNIAGNSWSYGTGYPDKIRGLTTVLYGGRIYAGGGYTISSVYSNKWRVMIVDWTIQ